MTLSDTATLSDRLCRLSDTDLQILLSDEVPCESSHKCEPGFSDGGCSIQVTHRLVDCEYQALICLNRFRYLYPETLDPECWCFKCNLPSSECRSFYPV